MVVLLVLNAPLTHRKEHKLYVAGANHEPTTWFGMEMQARDTVPSVRSHACPQVPEVPCSHDFIYDQTKIQRHGDHHVKSFEMSRAPPREVCSPAGPSQNKRTGTGEEILPMGKSEVNHFFRRAVSVNEHIGTRYMRAREQGQEVSAVAEGEEDPTIIRWPIKTNPKSIKQCGNAPLYEELHKRLGLHLKTKVLGFGRTDRLRSTGSRSCRKPSRKLIILSPVLRVSLMGLVGQGVEGRWSRGSRRSTLHRRCEGHLHDVTMVMMVTMAMRTMMTMTMMTVTMMTMMAVTGSRKLQDLQETASVHQCPSGRPIQQHAALQHRSPPSLSRGVRQRCTARGESPKLLLSPSITPDTPPSHTLYRNTPSTWYHGECTIIGWMNQVQVYRSGHQRPPQMVNRQYDPQAR